MAIVNSPQAGAFRHSGTTVRKGRPRNADVTRAVLDAARQLILEFGFHDLRLEHVAARAGVGKTTVYRRWASKHDLASDLLVDLARHEPVLDVGDTRAELVTAVTVAIDMLTMTEYGQILRALLSEVVIQVDLDDPHRPGIDPGRRQSVTQVVQRGIARGDLQAVAGSGFATDMLIGPIFFRLLFGGDLDDAFADTIVDAFLQAFGAS